MLRSAQKSNLFQHSSPMGFRVGDKFTKIIFFSYAVLEKMTLFLCRSEHYMQFLAEKNKKIHLFCNFTLHPIGVEARKT